MSPCRARPVAGPAATVAWACVARRDQDRDRSPPHPGTDGQLRREIREMKTARTTKRAARQRSSIPKITVAGYTNAGKSSLVNAMTGSGVLVQDALFATLDPTTRRATLTDGRQVVFTDTVGFVRHLPTQLVEAFRSTLEEVVDADLLLHVVDGSDPFRSNRSRRYAG